MTFVNYRTTLDRFRHIDALFVRASAHFSPEGSEAVVVVRFYPWWEHPLYSAALDHGDQWGFLSYAAGMREVTVRAIRPFDAHLTSRETVTDWDFSEFHPLLWTYSDPTTIYVNAPFDPERLLDELLSMEMPYVTRGDLLPYVYARARRSAPQGFEVPCQLYDPVCQAFERIGVPIFSPHVPKAQAAAVVFLLDESDYIIAEDFEVDVPEFVHDHSWFNPSDPRVG